MRKKRWLAWNVTVGPNATRVGAPKPRLVAEAVDAVASVYIVEVAAHNHVFAAVFGDVFFEGLDLVGTGFCRFGNFSHCVGAEKPQAVDVEGVELHNIFYNAGELLFVAGVR